MEERYIIPRDLKIKEVVAYGLNGKQMLYLTVGLTGVISIFTLGATLPLDIKLAGGVASLSSSLVMSLAKRHGQELDRYIANSIRYPLREKEFGGEPSVDVQKKVVPVLTIRYSLK